MAATGESGPPPSRKLRQGILNFKLASSSPSTSAHEATATSHDATNLLTHQDVDQPHPGEAACSCECCVHTGDEEGLTPFQPKDSGTIECTRRRQGQKSRLFLSNVVCYVFLDNILYYQRSSVLCICRYCVRKDLSSSTKRGCICK